ncbi:restriction endonuclease subunit S [Serratia ureilytica]|uniref:restriction endonuclease subunit S n=1 Tax=Serratia TaxID=613 RepID=UPI00164D7E3D|nr:restriction endonuclease subunit S [Serratia ureilytica]QNL00880.1 restriction endonuclease subunit S [Serratia ureilytica]
MSKPLEIQAEKVIPTDSKLMLERVIPEDWIVTSIDECAVKVGSGKTPTGGSNIYVDNGRPFVRSQNVGWGSLDLSDVAYITDEVHNTFSSSELQEDDVLLNITGASIGRCAKSNSHIRGGNVNQHVCIIRTDIKKLTPKLLVELINSEIGQSQIDSYQAGGNREGLNFSQVRQLKFSIPKNIKEQTAIANVLSDTDTLISALVQLTSKKRAIKTSITQQLVTGRTRLPQFSKRPDGTTKDYKVSELGLIPEDWNTESIYELADKQKNRFDDGDWIESEHIIDKGVRLIQTGNIGVGKFFDKESRKYISESSFEQLRCKELQIGDLLICRLAEPAGRACIFPDISEQKVITSVDVTIFRPDNNRANRQFLSQYFSSSEWFKNVHEQVGGTTHKRISRGALGKIIVPYPTVKEQTAIATILSDMDAELEALEQKLAKFRDIKQGMMQQLLTGRIRLPLAHQP